MNNTLIISEPSLGQIDQIKYLMNTEVIKEVPFVSFELESENIDSLAIEKALIFFLNRHESLRTIFPVIDNEIKQLILPFNKTLFGLNYYETDSESFANLKNDLYNKTQKQFSDLTKGPLFRAFLIKKNNVYFFSVLIHHLICDDWSLNIVKNELTQIYKAYLEGQEPNFIPLKYQLRDYCEELNSRLINNRIKLIEFWKNKLFGVQGFINMDNAYLTFQLRGGKINRNKRIELYDSRKSFIDILNKNHASMYTSVITEKKLINIGNIAAELRCAISSVFYSSFILFIYQYMNKKEVLLAALIADRGTVSKGRLIGCLLGGIYLSKNINGDMLIKDLIKETFCELLEAIENIIFNHDILELDGELLRSNCDIYINYISNDSELNLSNIEDIGIHAKDNGIYYPINCLIIQYSNCIITKWRYNNTLFSKKMIEDMVKCHENILDTIILSDFECRIEDLELFR